MTLLFSPSLSKVNFLTSISIFSKILIIQIVTFIVYMRTHYIYNYIYIFKIYIIYKIYIYRYKKFIV